METATQPIAAEFASADQVADASLHAWRPPPKLTLSQWADEKFYLSAEDAAPGRWKCMPFQVGIMDAISDPLIPFVSVMKSARVGFTMMVGAAIAYHMDQDPCSMLMVQPTVEDAKGWSKESLAPMLRDVPALAALAVKDLDEGGPKTSKNTIQAKRFPGGVISITGANSGTGFRRISRRVIILDEVDAYPPSAGSDGDPVKLATKRSETFWNRKRLAGSTPLVAGASRIEELFYEGDQRRFHVPCPQCEHFDFLVFSKREDGRGHYMQWPEGRPEDAYFVCSKNGCVIEHKDKREMVSRGRWVAEKPFAGHASFHIWAAYSFSANATWAQIVAEFLETKNQPEKLRTFVNTTLGETWTEKGEAPEWERLFNRREKYKIGTVPEGVLRITCGVDVQKDRWVYEVVGWGPGKESWSIAAGIILGDTARIEDWSKIDEQLLNVTWPTASGGEMPIHMLAVDSGYNTQVVYSWARSHPRNRVIAVKGSSGARELVGASSKVDVRLNGKRFGYRIFPVGVDIAKSELYGWLRMVTPEDGQPFPQGWCHFPEYGQDFFKQLTAEHLVETKHKKTGRITREWQVLPGRENHHLDARIYARAAAKLLQIDLVRVPPPAPKPPPPTGPTAPSAPGAPSSPASAAPKAAPPPPPAPNPPKQRKQIAADGGFLRGRGRGSWLKR